MIQHSEPQIKDDKLTYDSVFDIRQIDENKIPLSCLITKYPTQKQNQPTVFILPTHYSMTVSNVNQIDIQNTKADVNAILTIAVFYGDLLKDEIFKIGEKDSENKTNVINPQTLRDMMVIELSHKQNINLSDPAVEFMHRAEKKMLQFRIRKDFGTIICEDIFWTPFQNLHLVFSLRIQDINLMGEKKQDKIQSNNKIAQDKLQNLNKQIKKQDKNKDPEEKRWKVNRQTKIKFNFLKFLPNAYFQQENMGTQIYFADQLNIGEYEVDTKKTFSQNSMYRFPYQIAYRMNLKSLTQYKDQDINKKQNIVKKREQFKIKTLQTLNDKNEKSKVEIEEMQQLLDDDTKNFPELDHQKKLLEQVKKGERNSQLKGYKIRSFNYSHISITLFHHPTVTILTTLFPLLTIAFINLACYSISPSEEEWDVKKLTAIVTSIVAYIGLIPVVRSQIPPTDKPTIIQWMVFLELLPSIGAIIEMLDFQSKYAEQLKNNQEIVVQTFTWEFIALGMIPTAIVLSYCTFSLVIYLIRTYCFKYNISHFKMVDPGIQSYISRRELWNNPQFNLYVKKYKQSQSNSNDNRGKPS